MFRNLKKEKELIDKELELYQQEGKMKIDEQILEYKGGLVDMAKRCHDEMATFEHEYHSEKEERGIKIGELKVQVQALEDQKELVTQQKGLILESSKSYEDLLKAKDEEIERLDDLLNKMIENMPDFPEINVNSR